MTPNMIMNVTAWFFNRLIATNDSPSTNNSEGKEMVRI